MKYLGMKMCTSPAVRLQVPITTLDIGTILAKSVRLAGVSFPAVALGEIQPEVQIPAVALGEIQPEVQIPAVALVEIQPEVQIPAVVLGEIQPEVQISLNSTVHFRNIDARYIWKYFKFGWSFLRIFPEYCSGPCRNYSHNDSLSDRIANAQFRSFYAQSDHRFYVV